MTRDDLGSRVAAHYPSRFLRAYVRWKVRIDPVYAAVFERIGDEPGEILDVGCGIGVLAVYLRERGCRLPIFGIDHDERKISIARQVLPDATFEVGDARRIDRGAGTMLMLDLIHYFRSQDQAAILESAARVASTVIIRDAVRDGSWRYRVTFAQELFSRTVRWLRAERLHFATRDDLTKPFSGFSAEVLPLYGRTPFNNYLFVFRRSVAGITNA